METPNRNENIKYYIYARKSTDEKDRQILSLPTQVEDMKEIAAKNGIIQIYKTITESRSAKSPGIRPNFNQMIADIRAGKAQGIICWKIDRLARNPDEAGIIIGMLQRGEIKHIRTAEKDYYPEDNALLSYVEFGIANQYSRDLAINVKRGIDKKARMGKRPVLATIGYKNTKTNIKGEEEIVIDTTRFPLVKELWRYLLTGNYTVPQILKISNEQLHLTQPATKNRAERPLRLGMLYKMFSNPFYYGWYDWPLGSGNWIKGTHEPMITEDEFNQAQKVLGRKGKPQSKGHQFAFTGIMRCGNCGAMITAEEKVKRQKNGNVHSYVYYRCTKKLDANCPEKCIRLEELNKQIDTVLTGLHISERFQKWAIHYLHELRKDEARAQENSLEAHQQKLSRVTKQLDNLLIKFTSPENEGQGLISDTDYKTLKSSLLKQKSELERALQAQGQGIEEWLELSERTFNFARYARIWFEKGDMETRRAIFACLGSDFLFEQQRISFTMRKPFKFIFEGLPSAESELAGLARLELPETAENIIDYRVLTQQFTLWSG